MCISACGSTFSSCCSDTPLFVTYLQIDLGTWHFHTLHRIWYIYGTIFGTIFGTIYGTYMVPHLVQFMALYKISEKLKMKEEMQKMMGKLPMGGGANKFSGMGLPGFSGKPSKRIK